MSLQSLDSPSGCDPSTLETVGCFPKYSSSSELSRQVRAWCEDAPEPTLLTAWIGALRIPRPQPRGQSGPLSKTKGAFTGLRTWHFTPDELPASRLWASRTPAHTHTYKHTHMCKLIRIYTHTYIFLPFPTSLSFMLTHTSNTHIPLTVTQTLRTHTSLHSHNHMLTDTTHTLPSYASHLSHTLTVQLTLTCALNSYTPQTHLTLFTRLHGPHMLVHTFSHAFTLLHLALTHIALTLMLWYTPWEQVPGLRTLSVWMVSC